MSESKVATSAEVAAPASENLPAIAVDFLRRVRHTIDNGDADAKQLFQLADMDNDGALNQRELTSAAACFEVEGVKTPEGAAAMQALFRAAAGGADKIPIDKFISFVQGPAGQSGSTAKPAPDSTAPHAHLHGVEAVHALRYKLRHFVSAGLVRDYREVFDVLDVDHDGRVTIDELRTTFSDLQLEVTAEELVNLFNHIDENHDGSISIAEFLHFCGESDDVDEEAIHPHAHDSATGSPAKNSFPAASTPQRGRAKQGAAMQMSSPQAQAIYDAGDTSSIALLLREKLRGFVTRGLVEDVQHVFDMMDFNSNGYISKPEFVDSFKVLHMTVTPDEVEGLFAHINKDHNGNISMSEFLEFLGEEPLPGTADEPPPVIDAAKSSAPPTHAGKDEAESGDDDDDGDDDGDDADGKDGAEDADGEAGVADATAGTGDDEDAKGNDLGDDAGDDDEDAYSTDTFEDDEEEDASPTHDTNPQFNSGDPHGDDYDSDKPGGPDGLLVRGRNLAAFSPGRDSVDSTGAVDDRGGVPGDPSLAVRGRAIPGLNASIQESDNEDGDTSSTTSDEPGVEEHKGAAAAGVVADSDGDDVDVIDDDDGNGDGSDDGEDGDDDGNGSTSGADVDNLLELGDAGSEDSADVADVVERDEGYASHVPAAGRSPAQDRQRRAMGGSAFVQHLESLSLLARVLAFIAQLFRIGEITSDERALLKELALDGNEFLEGAMEVLALDHNVSECTHTFRRVVYAHSEQQ